jgi:hypothetical protein
MKKEITLEEAKEIVEKYTDVEYFISAHFQQGLGGHNEYWDNSWDLANYYHKCLEIIKENK